MIPEAEALLERGASDLNPLLFEPWLVQSLGSPAGERVWEGLLNRLELTADGAKLVDESISSRYRDEDKLLAELVRRTPDSPLIPLLARGAGGAFALLPTLQEAPEWSTRVKVEVRGRIVADLPLARPEEKSVDVPLEGPVTLRNEGPGKVFYQLVRRGPQAIPEGTTVTRSYLGSDVRRAPDGTWHIPRGATVKVHLSSEVRGKAVLADSLPAGLEALKPGSETQDRAAFSYLARARHRGRFTAAPAILRVDGSRTEGQSRSDVVVVD